MKIAVTGGAGFIGQNLVARLEANAADIRLLTRSQSCTTGLSSKYFVGDLASKDIALDGFLDDISILFNCAGEIRNKSLMYSLHVDGTVKLLNAVRNRIRVSNKPFHWVQLSSVGAYGLPVSAANENRIISENTPSNPVGEYEVTKTLADDLIKRFCDEEPLFTYTILRPSNVVGSGMSNQSFYSLIKMIDRNMFFYIGSRLSVATYIHVDDVISAMLLCATNDRAKGQIFNLSNDCKLSEIVSAVTSNSTFSPPILSLPEIPLRYAVKLLNLFGFKLLTQERIDALVRHTYYPYSKIEEMLGFIPKHSIPDFVSNMFEKK